MQSYPPIHFLNLEISWFLKCKVWRAVLSFPFVFLWFGRIGEGQAGRKEEEEGPYLDISMLRVLVRKWTSRVCVRFSPLTSFPVLCPLFSLVTFQKHQKILNTKRTIERKNERRTDQKEKGSDGSYPFPLSNPLEDAKLKPLLDHCEECL